MQAFEDNDVARQEALYRAYEQDTTIAASWMSFRLMHDIENPDASLRFANLALQEGGNEQQRGRASTNMSYVEAERGQMRSAIARLIASNQPNKRVMFAEFGILPLYRIPADQLAVMRAEMERMDSLPRNADPVEQVRPHVRLYRLALLSCRAGDYAAANAYAQRIRSLPVPPVYQRSMARAADEIDAQVDVANGRYQQAVQRLAAHREMYAADVGAGFMWGGVGAAWLAEALYQSGRYEEAQKRFDSLDEGLLTDGPHISYILLRRAQIADAQNRGADARDLYARFLKYWTQPDAEMKPVVDQARTRLAALQQKAG